MDRVFESWCSSSRADALFWELMLHFESWCSVVESWCCFGAMALVFKADAQLFWELLSPILGAWSPIVGTDALWLYFLGALLYFGSLAFRCQLVLYLFGALRSVLEASSYFGRLVLFFLGASALF